MGFMGHTFLFCYNSIKEIRIKNFEKKKLESILSFLGLISLETKDSNFWKIKYLGTYFLSYDQFLLEIRKIMFNSP